VPVDLKTNEWNSLRDQFRALVRDESLRDESIEKFFDYEIRRRFGEAISRACGGRGKTDIPVASENDYVELAQEQLLRRRVD
jgi:hypothetical protein